ncbi:hypothetical protein [Desulfosporosinus sp. FKA]|uniref:hypothetical protein n=1 Tax=Desulfosporosinus sp. FKA TaxID=1969834 RepID=UPI000B4A3859|nr:hypothetical protein [Desulfosporosinus sp. FKA]
MNRRLLILESNWAEDDDSYIKDSRSTTKIYTSIETLLSVNDSPVQIIQRPLLRSRFVKDIEQFIDLDSNKTIGINIVILSAHGRIKKVKLKEHNVHYRKLSAIDGEINLNIENNKIKELLHRTIIILDSCSVGSNLQDFLETSGALGVIGFSEDVDWIDSAVFILALLCKFQNEDVFLMKRKSYVRPKKIIEQMKKSHYEPFFEKLGIEYCFNE